MFIYSILPGTIIAWHNDLECMLILPFNIMLIEPPDGISNNVVCATSKGSDQPAHTRILVIASLEYSMTLGLLTEHHLANLKRGLHMLV